MYAGKSARSACIYGANGRVRVRAADKRNMQQARNPDVVDEAAFAGQKRGIFQPPEARADAAIALGVLIVRVQ
jgi:hypothetical protein